MALVQETGGDTFAIFEWVFPPNVGLIPRYPLGVLPKPGFRDNCLVTDDGLAEEFDLLSSVRYASGRAITSVACGALCAQAYFCPGPPRLALYGACMELLIVGDRCNGGL